MSTQIWKAITKNRNAVKEFLSQYPRNNPDNVEIDLPSDYLERELYETLTFALETCIRLARDRDYIKRNKSTFHPLDFIAELLINYNPNKTEEINYKRLFQLDWVQEYLLENPRPIYPLSYTLCDDEAATIIQKWFRGHLVRIEPDVTELRDFWKNLKNTPDEAPSVIESIKKPSVCSFYRNQKQPKLLKKKNRIYNVK